MIVVVSGLYQNFVFLTPALLELVRISEEFLFLLGQVTQNLPMKEGCTEVSLLRVGWSVDFSHPQLGKVIFNLIVFVFAALWAV